MEWHLLVGFFFSFWILVRLNTIHVLIGYSGFLICELLPIYPLSIFIGSFIFFLLICGILCPVVPQYYGHCFQNPLHIPNSMWMIKFLI